MNARFGLGQEVTHTGRPVIVMARPMKGATGEVLYGVRYLDMPRWEDVPGFPGMRKPTTGSCVIARESDLS